MAKLVSGSARSDGGHRVAEQEADTDHEAGSFVDEALHALGTVAVACRGRLEPGDTEVGNGLVEAGAGGVVERTVATAGDVIDHADGRAVAGRRRIGAGGAVGGCFGGVRRVGRRTSGVVIAAAGCQAECGDDADGEQLLALDHVLPFRMKWFVS